MLRRLQTEFEKYPGGVEVEIFSTEGVSSFRDSRESVGTTGPTPGRVLLADAELADDAFIPLGIVFLQIIQQAAALADQHEKSAARAVVFLVRLEVLRQLADTLAEQRNLNFGTAGIARMRAVTVNEGFLLLSG
jgi:hypothetical protein